MSKLKDFSIFLQSGSKYMPSTNLSTHNRLPAGVYNANMDRDGNVFLVESSLNSDKLIDLPSTEFEQLIGEMEFFLKPETKWKFKEMGFLYKRSALLHGLPGTGKTCMVARVANKVVENGGIVLMNPDPRMLSGAFHILNTIQPDVNTLVVFEEFNETLEDFEEILLSILDGEVQKDNIMYLATTNFIDQIPARILRPGRFSSVIEVKYPDIKARLAYLNTKLNDLKKINELANVTEGFSIDEVKELVLSTECLQQDVKYVIDRIKFTKGIVKELPASSLDKRMKQQVQLNNMIKNG